MKLAISASGVWCASAVRAFIVASSGRNRLPAASSCWHHATEASTRRSSWPGSDAKNHPAFSPVSFTAPGRLRSQCFNSNAFTCRCTIRGLSRLTLLTWIGVRNGQVGLWKTACSWGSCRQTVKLAAVCSPRRPARPARWRKFPGFGGALFIATADSPPMSTPISMVVEQDSTFSQAALNFASSFFNWRLSTCAECSAREKKFRYMAMPSLYSDQAPASRAARTSGSVASHDRIAVLLIASPWASSTGNVPGGVGIWISGQRVSGASRHAARANSPAAFGMLG